MSVPMGQTDPQTKVDPQLPDASNWTINVSDVRTVKASNVSLAASEQDIKEFFSFSGDIQFVEMQSGIEGTQLAYVTFKSPQGADTAVLLSGATIADCSVTVTPVENYLLPPEAVQPSSDGKLLGADSAVKKAEDVVSSMLAKGFVLGKDALNKAKMFDQRLHLTSNASSTVASLNQKIGLSDKISTGTAVVNEKVREMDEKFHVTEKTKSALAVAEQKASSAGSVIMSNPYVSTGASWVSSALGMVAKAAEEVSTMTKEKVEKAEEEKMETICRERKEIVNNFSQIHLDDSSIGEPPVVPLDSTNDNKLGII